MSVKRVAIDLTWVRHEKVGGTESSIRNLLDGLETVHDDAVLFYLLLTRDNAESFHVYIDRGYFRELMAPIQSAKRGSRVLWQNLKLCRLLRQEGITDCIEPVYGMPFTDLQGIRFYTIIHDLQAIHYPEYFNPLRRIWMRLSWRNTCRRAYRIVAISDYTASDIATHFHPEPERLVRIYNAIKPPVTVPDAGARDEIYAQLGVRDGRFFFTIASLLPHKNLKILLEALALLKQRNPKAFYPAVLAGVGGHQETELLQWIRTLGLTDDIRLPGYVSDEARNALYMGCRAFLFPSLYEGFGMPPVEALLFKKPVITTNRTSIPEVTHGLAQYVDDPHSAEAFCTALSHIDEARPDEAALETLRKTYLPEKIAGEWIICVTG